MGLKDLKPHIFVNIHIEKNETTQDAMKRGLVGLEKKPDASMIQIVRRSQNKTVIQTEFAESYVVFWRPAPFGTYRETVKCDGRELATMIANGGVESFVLEKEYKRI